jgi:hypothetical protein
MMDRRSDMINEIGGEAGLARIPTLKSKQICI